MPSFFDLDSSSDSSSTASAPPSPVDPSFASPLPKFIPFEDLQPVVELLRSTLGCENVAVSHLRRVATNLLREHTSASPPPHKPHAFNIRDMFQAEHFGCGTTPVSDHPLKVDVIEGYHVMCCSDCSMEGFLLPDCYFNKMLDTIKYGWAPLMHGTLNRHSPYVGNYPAASKFAKAMTKEIDKWLERGVVKEIPASVDAYLTPLNCVVKNSDRHRAHAVTGLGITDDRSLEVINGILDSTNLAPIKVRPVCDLTASGVNDMTIAPPFSYAGIADALAVIRPNCWLVKKDIVNYFGCFPLAEFLWWLFCFEFLGRFYQALCIVFGLRPAPYFCSVWGAELHMWFSAMGIVSVHMQDDFLFPADSLQDAKAISSKVDVIFNSSGWPTNPLKDEIAQKLVYVGFQLDSTAMTCSFSKQNAEGFLYVFRRLAANLRDRSHVDLKTLTSVAGKLNDFAQLLQEGRSHVRPFWKYIHSHPSCTPDLREDLFADIAWWTDKLETWADDKVSGHEFPILNSAVFQKDSKRVLCLVTDASGLQTDGFGGIWAWLYGDDTQALAASWALFRQLASHSHGLELQALLHLLQKLTASDMRNILLIWITDCSAACWTINKGYCSDPESFNILTKILQLADLHGISIVGLWVPREQISLCDYLTHLTAVTHRELVTCAVSELASPENRFPVTNEKPAAASDAAAVSVVCDEPGSGQPLHHSPASPSLPVRLCDKEQRLGEITFQYRIDAPDFIPASTTSLAGRDRCAGTTSLCATAEVPGHYSLGPQGTADAVHPTTAVVDAYVVNHGPYLCSSAVDGTRRSSPGRRDLAPVPGSHDSLGPSSPLLHCLPRQNKDSPIGSSSGDSFQRPRRPLRCQSAPPAIRRQKSVVSADGVAVSYGMSQI